MENALKSCPFCGCDDIHLIDRIDCENGLQNYYHVKCKECGVMTNEYKSKYDAIMAWNKRVSE